MVIVIASGRPKADRREDFLSAARQMAAAARADDACVSYGFFASIEDDTVVSGEVWADRASLDAHMARPHTAAFLDRAAELTDGPADVAFYDTAD